MNGNCKPVQNQGKGLWQFSFAFSVSALFAGLLLAMISASSVSAQSTKKYKIGALTKSLANPYFLLMKQGYEYAQKKLGVEVVFGSTPTEEADVEQLNILQSWLAEGSLEGYFVTPFRATSLNSVLTRVSRKNLPIINIDELIPEDAAKADGVKIVARIASNNAEAAKLDAQLMLSSISKGSDVAIIEGDPGTTSSMERVTGFTNAAKEGGLNIVASQPANWNRKKAGELATNILQGDSNLKAIFVANDDIALGVVRAVQATGAIYSPVKLIPGFSLSRFVVCRPYFPANFFHVHLSTQEWIFGNESVAERKTETLNRKQSKAQSIVYCPR